MALERHEFARPEPGAVQQLDERPQPVRLRAGRILLPLVERGKQPIDIRHRQNARQGAPAPGGRNFESRIVAPHPFVREKAEELPERRPFARERRRRLIAPAVHDAGHVGRLCRYQPARHGIRRLHQIAGVSEPRVARRVALGRQHVEKKRDRRFVRNTVGGFVGSPGHAASVTAPAGVASALSFL